MAQSAVSSVALPEERAGFNARPVPSTPPPDASCPLRDERTMTPPRVTEARTIDGLLLGDSGI
jgi:hypothetical protein